MINFFGASMKGLEACEGYLCLLGISKNKVLTLSNSEIEHP